MSIKSWKLEFFNIPLNKTNKHNCVDHGIKKWTGLSKKNLLKHKLIKKDNILKDEEGNEFKIGWESCALCYNYYDKKVSNSCYKCPLSKGGKPTDPRKIGCNHVYNQFRHKGRSTLMLQRLKVVKRKENG